MLTLDLINRVITYNNVNSTDPNNRDSFLEDIDVLSKKHPDLIRNNEESFKYLTRYENVKRFINICFKRKIDIFIGGSYPLSSCFIPCKYKPSDIDIYIKNCSLEKLVLIENIIRKVYCPSEEYELLVVRCPIVITWYIIKHNNVIDQIQANILNINSWSEIFVTYHSDIVCVGYDVMLKKFRYLKSRWENIAKQDKVHVFSNIFSCDSKASLERSVSKYKERGFNCVYNFVKKDLHTNETNLVKEQWEKGFGENLYDVIESSDSNNGNESLLPNPYVSVNDILNVLATKYKGRSNICYSQTVKNLYVSNENVPNEIDLWKLYYDKKYFDFMTEPSRCDFSCMWIKTVKKILSEFCHKDIVDKIINYSHYCDNVCQIDSKQQNIFIQEGYCRSYHDPNISLYSYLKLNRFEETCTIPDCSRRREGRKYIVKSKCQ